MNSPYSSFAGAQGLIILHKFDIAGVRNERFQSESFREISPMIFNLLRRNFKWTFNIELTKFHFVVP